MSKKLYTVSEYCVRFVNKPILTAVIAGITFFFNPVFDTECSDTFDTVHQIDLCEGNHASSIVVDEEFALFPSESYDIPLNDGILMSLDSSFKKNCKNLEVGYPLFQTMMFELRSLPIEEGYADYGNKSGNIHFNMFLKDDLRLTVDKNVSTSDDDNVTFSLSVGSELLALDEMRLSDVVDVVEKLLS